MNLAVIPARSGSTRIKNKNMNIKFDNKTSIYKQLAINFNIVSYQSSILNLAYKNKNRILSSALNKKLKFII